jgi:hypothetical protein
MYTICEQLDNTEILKKYKNTLVPDLKKTS